MTMEGNYHSISITSGDRCSAGFVDLCYNYLHERLQLLFFNSQVDQLTEKEKSLAKVFDLFTALFAEKLSEEIVFNYS